MVSHTHPVSGGQLIRTLREGGRIITIANSKAGSTPTLGTTRINLSVNSNASMTGRTSSVAVVSGSFDDVNGTIV